MFEINYFFEILPVIASKLPVTLKLTLMSAVFALLIGTVVAVIAYYKVKILYPITMVYVSIMRGTPIVAQLYLFLFWTCCVQCDCKKYGSTYCSSN